jgi:hypothetical protein
MLMLTQWNTNNTNIGESIGDILLGCLSTWTHGLYYSVTVLHLGDTQSVLM